MLDFFYYDRWSISWGNLIISSDRLWNLNLQLVFFLICKLKIWIGTNVFAMLSPIFLPVILCYVITLGNWLRRGEYDKEIITRRIWQGDSIMFFVLLSLSAIFFSCTSPLSYNPLIHVSSGTLVNRLFNIHVFPTKEWRKPS